MQRGAEPTFAQASQDENLQIPPPLVMDAVPPFLEQSLEIEPRSDQQSLIVDSQSRRRRKRRMPCQSLASANRGSTRS